MSWREQLQPGSFRGVGFLTERHDAEGGRRVASHEFPLRDAPFAEDLGRRQRRFAIDCLIIGAEYMAGRDQLIAALEARDAGRLVHPYLGEHSVAVETYRLSESTEEGGIARFSISFVESGQSLASDASADSNGAALFVADAAAIDAVARFEAQFTVAGSPSFVEEGAAALVSATATAAATSARILGGAGKALRAFETGLGALDGAIALVRAPIDLAHNLRGMIGALATLGRLPRLRIRALMAVADDIVRSPLVIGSTPDRNRERANRDHIEDLVTTLCAAEAVATAAGMTFPSYADAVDLRDWLADRLDRIEVAAADAGRDEQAASIAALSRAMVRDVSDRGASLARLIIVTPLATEPAVVIANRVYGPGDIARRVDELVERNSVMHPGFLTGGVPLAMLSVAEAERRAG